MSKFANATARDASMEILVNTVRSLDQINGVLLPEASKTSYLAEKISCYTQIRQNAETIKSLVEYLDNDA